MLVAISVSTVVSRVLCEVAIVDERVGLAVIVVDVSISLIVPVSIEYKIKKRVR
jgi:hypothetical protein